MPKWGLTESQRDAAPWGLPAHLLQPSKTITDPIHGDIYLTKLEQMLLDTRAMQRLRRVRQLGTTHLVYAGATHSRLSHAKGTLRAAQDLMDAVVDNLSGPREYPDHLFKQWGQRGKDLPEDLYPKVPNRPAETTLLDLALAEATVLARLGGLLHDLCHVPLGHTIEDDLQVLTPHDENAARFEKLWAQLHTDAPDAMEAIERSQALKREIRALVLSKEKGSDGKPLEFESKYPFVTDIVGNTICADLMDYLRRDHYYCGLPLALGSRFVNDFFVMKDDAVRNRGKMVIRISRDGHLRADVVSELVKYLRYRYELSERVLYHHAKVAADAMIGKLLEMRVDALWVDAVADPEYLHNDLAKDRRRSVDALRAAVVERDGTAKAEEIDALVKAQVEEDFVSRSDDGLLEHLAHEAGRTAATDSRSRGIAELARSVLDRNLFKVVSRGESEADQANAEQIHSMHGAHDQRRQLEQSATDFAGITPGWHLVLWVPNPNMRMKIADVLVDYNGSVASLSSMPGTSGESMSIVEKHQRLWGVSVYVHPSLMSEKNSRKLRAALAWIHDKMDVRLQMLDGSPVPTLADLLFEDISETLRLDRGQRSSLRNQVSALPSGLGGSTTYKGLVESLVGLGRAYGWISDDMSYPNGLI